MFCCSTIGVRDRDEDIKRVSRRSASQSYNVNGMSGALTLFSSFHFTSSFCKHDSCASLQLSHAKQSLDPIYIVCFSHHSIASLQTPCTVRDIREALNHPNNSQTQTHLILLHETLRLWKRTRNHHSSDYQESCDYSSMITSLRPNHNA